MSYFLLSLSNHLFQKGFVSPVDLRGVVLSNRVPWQRASHHHNLRIVWANFHFERLSLLRSYQSDVFEFLERVLFFYGGVLFVIGDQNKVIALSCLTAWVLFNIRSSFVRHVWYLNILKIVGLSSLGSECCLKNLFFCIQTRIVTLELNFRCTVGCGIESIEWVILWPFHLDKVVISTFIKLFHLDISISIFNSVASTNILEPVLWIFIIFPLQYYHSAICILVVWISIKLSLSFLGDWKSVLSCGTNTESDEIVRISILSKFNVWERVFVIDFSYLESAKVLFHIIKAHPEQTIISVFSEVELKL